MSLTMPVQTMHFVIETSFILKAIKRYFEGHMINSHTLVVISYAIYETRQRLVPYISYEMTTCVRAPIYTHYYYSYLIR